MNPHKLVTPRLALIAATAELIHAELHDRRRFFRFLRVEEALDWPPADLVDALPVFQRELEEHPELVGWLAWYWILRCDEGNLDVLVGGGGFKGPPRGGMVEIGYHVREAHRRRGYATEAVRALVSWAFSHAGVQIVAADTATDNTASRALLERLSFVPAGAGSEPGLIRYELRRALDPGGHPVSTR